MRTHVLALCLCSCVTVAAPVAPAPAPAPAPTPISASAGDDVPASTPVRVASPRPFSVRFVYLVSADQQPRESLRASLEATAREAQAYYLREVGETFTLNEPVVEVVRSTRPSSWFYDTPTTQSSNPEDRGYYNTLDELRSVLGGDQNQQYTWFVYSDGPGTKGRATSGVAVVPNDGHFETVSADSSPFNLGRWVGGTIHELGHALGLPERAEAVMMGTAWYTYPDAHLTNGDVAILRASPFFGTFTPLAAYVYEGGSFQRIAKGSTFAWVELKDDGRVFHFVEQARDKRGFTLHDEMRSVTISIPERGGMASLSANGGAWLPLYVVAPPT